MAVTTDSSTHNVSGAPGTESPSGQPHGKLPVPLNDPLPSSKPQTKPEIETDQESSPSRHQPSNLSEPTLLEHSSDEAAINGHVGIDETSSLQHHTKHMKVELNPFQLLFSPAMISTSEEMELLRVTKDHLSNNLLADDATFRRLEVFQFLRDRQGANMKVDGYTMVAFGGNSYFDEHVAVDRVHTTTMLAFLGKNLTDYTLMLQESAVSVSDAQLYTLDGHMVEYSDGAMHIENGFPEEESMDSMMSMTMYIVAIGIPVIICGLISLGYCSLQMKGYNLCRPKTVDPEHETWNAQRWYRDDNDFVNS